jgi:hypothetical protein
MLMQTLRTPRGHQGSSEDEKAPEPDVHTLYQRESEQWCLSCAPAICLRQSLLISVIFFSAHLHFESFLFSPSFIFQFMFFFFNLSFADFGSVAPDPPPKKMKSLALTPEHRLADFASLVPLLSRFLVPPLIL